MANVLNKSARPYNLKTMRDGRRYLVRLIPGVNFVPDKVWGMFCPAKGIVDEYVDHLIDKGELSVGIKSAAEYKEVNSAAHKDEPVASAGKSKSAKKSKKESADVAEDLESL